MLNEHRSLLDQRNVEVAVHLQSAVKRTNKVMGVNPFEQMFALLVVVSEELKLAKSVATEEGKQLNYLWADDYERSQGEQLFADLMPLLEELRPLHAPTQTQAG